MATTTRTDQTERWGRQVNHLRSAQQKLQQAAQELKQADQANSEDIGTGDLQESAERLEGRVGRHARAIQSWVDIGA